VGLGRTEEEWKQKEQSWRELNHSIYLGIKSIILLEISQALPAHPSDKDRMGAMKLGW
jgi:hypothetical protein